MIGRTARPSRGPPSWYHVPFIRVVGPETLIAPRTPVIRRQDRRADRSHPDGSLLVVERVPSLGDLVEFGPQRLGVRKRLGGV